MKIYAHEKSRYSVKIRTREIEVEEKAKTYLTPDRHRVFKEDINKLKGGYFQVMYTLTPDNTPFIEALVKEQDTEIENLLKSLKHAEARKTELLKLLYEKGAVAHGDQIPAEACGEV